MSLPRIDDSFSLMRKENKCEWRQEKQRKWGKIKTKQAKEENFLTGCGAEPVSVGREGESVDGVASIEGVKMFSFVQIPQHGLTVLATGSAKGAVGRHGDRVQVARVADVVRLQLAVGQVPNLRGEQ